MKSIQTSGEIRLASPTGQTLNGHRAYYHDADLYTDQPNTIDVEVLRNIPGLAGGIGSRLLLGAPLLELWGADLTRTLSGCRLYFSYLESVGFIATDGWPQVYG